MAVDVLASCTIKLSLEVTKEATRYPNPRTRHQVLPNVALGPRVDLANTCTRVDQGEVMSVELRQFWGRFRNSALVQRDRRAPHSFPQAFDTRPLQLDFYRCEPCACDPMRGNAWSDPPSCGARARYVSE